MKATQYMPLLATIFVLQFNALFAQNPAAPYVAPTYTNGCSWTGNQGAVTNDLISNFYTTGGITNIQNYFSGCGSQQVPNNYTLYPPIPTKLLTVARGQQFKVHTAASTAFSQSIRVWIDWNQNNTYQNPTNTTPLGELVSSTPNPIQDPGYLPSDTNFYHSGFITVPMTALCGPTRMRVRSVFANPTFDPTSSYTFGEVEEYWVVVVGNPQTSMPTVLDADTSICAGGDITISTNASGTISFFSELYLNTQLTAAATNIITSNSFTFLGLTRDTNVYVQNFDNNCKSERTQVRVQVEPIRTIDVSPDTAICPLDTAILKGHIDTVATIFKTFTSTAFTGTQTNNFANRIPDNYTGQHPGSFLRNYINVNNVAPLTLQPGSIVEVGVRISHNRLKDVDIFLVSPNGQQRELSTDNGNANPNNNSNYGSGTGNAIVYCIFRDDATALVTAATGNSITGIKKPEQTIDGFTGSPNGTWTLKVGDDEGLANGTDTDNGRLLRWYIKFKRTPNDTVVVWSPGATLADFAPTVTVEDSLKKFAFPLVTTEYYFDVYSVPGCKARDSVTVSINTNIQLTVSSQPAQICVGAQATLTASTALSGIDSTYWSNAYLPQDDSTFVVNPTTTTSYTVIALNNDGCLDTTTFNLVVNPLPTAPTISATTPTTFCTGGNVTLQSSQSTGNSWSTGQSTASINLVASSPNITLIYTDGNGCVSPASAATSVVVNPLPASPLITPSGSTTFCQGNSITLNGPAGYTYNWTHDGVASYATTQNITVNAGNTYSLLITDANSCTSNSINTTVVVNPLPATPTVTPQGPTSFCPGSNVVLQSTAAVGYTWIPSAANAQNNTVNANGSYRVKVTDANGCTSLPSAPVVVSLFAVPATPIITPSGATSFCIGNNVNLSAPTATSYLWNPGAQTTQAINVTVSGVFSVQVTNSDGCNSAFSTNTSVTVNPLPVAPTISPLTPTTICDGDFATLSAGNFASYQWSNGATNNPTDIGLAGAYSVIVTDANGCTSPTSNPINIAVNSLPPTPSIAANGSTTFCAFDSVELACTTTLANPSYLWNPLTPNIDNSNVYVNLSGTYTARVVDGNGCSSMPSNSIPVVVNPIPPIPVITPSGSTTFCDGDTIDLVVGPGVSFVWNNGNTTNSISVTQSNTYGVVVTDACEVIHNVTIPITVLTKPVSDFAADDSAGCVPHTVNFINLSTNADTYTWYLTNNNIDNTATPTFEYTDPANYNITLIAKSNNGCIDTKTVSNMIRTSKKPEVDFDYFPKPAFVSTPFIQFESIVTGATNILWRCAEYNFTDTVNRIKLSMQDTGVHKMTLIAMNNDGCADSVTYDIVVDGDFIIYVPNAFTPGNNDTLNNVFKPSMLYLDKKNYKLRIFDRWGTMIYQTNDANLGWNGTINLQPAFGTFSWMIDCLDSRGVRHFKDGSVTVVR